MISVELIKQFEGFKAKPYIDPVGIPTIGYGTTYITEADAVYLLKSYVQREIVPVLDSAVDVPLSCDQLSALCSLIYNIGSEAFKKSTLLKKLNKGDYDGAADEFMRWNKAGGKVLKGLTRRREAERELFLTNPKG